MLGGVCGYAGQKGTTLTWDNRPKEKGSAFLKMGGEEETILKLHSDSNFALDRCPGGVTLSPF